MDKQDIIRTEKYSSRFKPTGSKVLTLDFRIMLKRVLRYSDKNFSWFMIHWWYSMKIWLCLLLFKY